MSEDFYKELSTAGDRVCSTTLPMGTVKRPGQLYIQTWHGDKAIKKIGNDAASDIIEYKRRTTARKFCESKICDYFVTGCEFFVPIAKSALGYSGKFLRCGMPRNDCLFSIDSAKCDEIRNKLGIGKDKKIMIYAPTFRDYSTSHDEVSSDIDLIAILDTLQLKYNCDWICLMRAHDGRRLTLNNKSVQDKRFKDVTSYPDIADLLMIADMVVSDYSSCGADFSITGKMVLMYQDDIDKYITHGRTLYFSQEESPYYTATNMKDALALIKSVSEEDIKNNCKEILEFYKSCETGKACKVVCEKIIDALGKIEGAKQHTANKKIYSIRGK